MIWANFLKQFFSFTPVNKMLMCVAKESYIAKPNEPRFVRDIIYLLNIVMSHIIPQINQFEINPCLLIHEIQNQNQACKRYHSGVQMRFDVSLNSKQPTISKSLSMGTNKSYMPDTGKFPYQMPYLGKSML